MRKIIYSIVALCGAISAHAQGIAVNADGANPDTSAIFDIKSTTKGFLMPRMTQAERDAIALPARSLMIYQTDNDSGFYYRRGNIWYPLADNLGTHKLTQNLITDGKYISRTGDNLGIRPWDNGTVRFYGYNSIVGATWETARLDESGGFVAFGSLGYGIIPATGNGSRMMWYPFKSAFRAGAVDGNTGSWDDANTGFYSAAFGLNTKVTAVYSFGSGYNCLSSGTAANALGYSVAATGNYSNAMGYQSGATEIASVAIGYRDTASGQAAVAMGYLCTASGDYSVALGYRSNANNFTGGFTASDAASTTGLSATANNQFSARYSGGYRFFSNATMTLGVNLAAGANSWTSISDSNKKERFIAADGELFLRKLRTMRLGSWNYKVQRASEFRHYGPMAQEFYAAYGKDRYGTIGNDTTIASADMDGVLMIMIKALEHRTAEQADTITDLKAENDQLKKQLAAAGKTSEEWEAFKSLMAENESAKVFMEQVSKLAETRRQSLAGNSNR